MTSVSKVDCNLISILNHRKNKTKISMLSLTYFSCTADNHYWWCVCFSFCFFFSQFFFLSIAVFLYCESLFLNEYIKIHHTTQDCRLNTIDSCFVLFQLVTPTMKALFVRWVRPMWCSHMRLARHFFKCKQRNNSTHREQNQSTYVGYSMIQMILYRWSLDVNEFLHEFRNFHQMLTLNFDFLLFFLYIYWMFRINFALTIVYSCIFHVLSFINK